MPKDTKSPAAERLKALTEKKSAAFEEYLGRLPPGTSLNMADPYAASKKLRAAEVAKWPEESKKQLERLKRAAEAAKARKDAAEEKKVMDELSALMASAPLGTELGPPREGTFRTDYERITDVPYEEVVGRARKSRKSKKGKKGGKKTRKGGKTRRH